MLQYLHERATWIPFSIRTKLILNSNFIQKQYMIPSHNCYARTSDNFLLVIPGSQSLNSNKFYIHFKTICAKRCVTKKTLMNKTERKLYWGTFLNTGYYQVCICKRHQFLTLGQPRKNIQTLALKGASDLDFMFKPVIKFWFIYSQLTQFSAFYRTQLQYIPIIKMPLVYFHLLWYLIKQEVLGRTNHLLSFDMTWTA
jgi:hypothetical protein